jgi:hypothetical protein
MTVSEKRALSCILEVVFARPVGHGRFPHGPDWMRFVVIYQAERERLEILLRPSDRSVRPAELTLTQPLSSRRTKTVQHRATLTPDCGL